MMTYRKTDSTSYRVACPYCGAEVGKPCFQVKDPTRWISAHQGRRELAAARQEET